MGALEGPRDYGPHAALVAGVPLPWNRPGGAVLRASSTRGRLAVTAAAMPQLAWGFVGLPRGIVMVRCYRGLLHCLGVPVVPRALAQEKEVLMRLRAAIAYRLGHRVWLVPNDVLAQIPTVGLQRERDAPRDADQFLGLDPRKNSPRGVAAFPAPRIAISEVEPQHAVIAQHPSHLAKHGDHLRHEVIGRRLKPDLPRVTVVAKPVVGRACHAALRASGGKRAQRVPAVPRVDSKDSPIDHARITPFSCRSASIRSRSASASPAPSVIAVPTSTPKRQKKRLWPSRTSRPCEVCQPPHRSIASRSGACACCRSKCRLRMAPCVSGPTPGTSGTPPSTLAISPRRIASTAGSSSARSPSTCSGVLRAAGGGAGVPQ